MRQRRMAPATPDLLERLEQAFWSTSIGLEHENVVVLVEPVASVIELDMASAAIVLDSNEDNLVIQRVTNDINLSGILTTTGANIQA